jgi:hypothetical protein
MIELLIILGIATAIVLIKQEPGSVRAVIAQIGGWGWILWALLQIIRYLLGRG